MDGQGTKWCRKIAENFKRLSRVHEPYRQTTDGLAIADSEREREFTFANKSVQWHTLSPAVAVYIKVAMGHRTKHIRQSTYGFVLLLVDDILMV